MANQKVSDMTTRAPQSTDLLMLAVEDMANYKAAVPTFGMEFYPEWYGAVGDGVTDDTAAIQAAIDAAEVDGGIVRLTQTYNIFPTLEYDFGIYANYTVGLHVNADRVWIVGPGTIVMRTLPALGGARRLGVVMFGNGTSYVSQVGITDVEFDFTEHTKANLLAISTLGGVTIGFMLCESITCSHNTMRQAYTRGGYGAILTLNATRFGEIADNRILGCTNNAIWIDGASGVMVSGNMIIGEEHGVTEDIGGAGIVLVNNTDVDTGVDNNIILGNVVINPRSNGLALRGLGNVVIGNRMSTKYGTTTGFLRLRYGDAGGLDYPVEDSVIVGNLIRRDAAPAAGTAVEFIGVDVGANANPVEVTRTLFAHNNINDAWAIGIDMDEQATGNWIYDNVNEATTPIQFNATATANILHENHHVAIGTFAVDDATPSVMGNSVWQTANANPTTVTMLDDGFVGQRVTVLIQDANTTIDFTGTNLKGNAGGDWNPANGDLMTCTFDGTDWYCDVIDAT